MAQLKAYSFLDVAATLAGPGGFVQLGSGAASAKEGITFAPTEDQGSMTVGADGEGIHALHANKSGQITIRLLKNSPANQALSALVNFQRTSAANWGQNTIECREKNRGDVWVCTQVAFKKVPETNYAEEPDTITWEFQAIKMEFAYGA